jgi:hypothetical protein
VLRLKRRSPPGIFDRRCWSERAGVEFMHYDNARIEDTVLALLGAFEFDNGRAWKRFDFDVMEALFAEGLITDPRGRQESVHLTEAGLERAKLLGRTMFGQC